jgi:O-antigen/teichoic acid export membrane protein
LLKASGQGVKESGGPVVGFLAGAKFRAGLATIFGSQVTCAAISLALEAIYARLLGPAGRGQLGLCLMATAAAAVLGGAGIEVPITIWAADGKKQVRDWLSSVVFGGAVGCLLATGLWVATYWLWEPGFLHGITPGLAVVVALTIPCNLLFSYTVALLTGKERFAGRGKVLIVDQVVNLAVAIALVGLWQRSAAMAGLANAIGLAIGALLAIFLLRTTLSMKFSVPAAKEYLPKALSLGVRAQAGNVATFFNYRLDVFIVNYFLDTSQVGLYAIGVLVSEGLWQIPNAIAVALLPRTARTAEAGSVPFTCAVVRHVFLIACASGVAVAALSPYLIPLIFGARFSPSVSVIWWILPGTIALAVGKVMAADLAAREKPEYSSMFAAVALVVTVALDLLLIPRMGISGAALASSAAYLVDTILLGGALVRHLQVSWAALLVPTREDLSLYRDTWRRIGALVPAH